MTRTSQVAMVLVPPTLYGSGCKSPRYMNLCIFHTDISVGFGKASIVGLAGFDEELFYLK